MSDVYRLTLKVSFDAGLEARDKKSSRQMIFACNDR
jgi:hypothetical protein